jgi:hypothetical protein
VVLETELPLECVDTELAIMLFPFQLTEVAAIC